MKLLCMALMVSDGTIVQTQRVWRYAQRHDMEKTLCSPFDTALRIFGAPSPPPPPRLKHASWSLSHLS